MEHTEASRSKKEDTRHINQTFCTYSDIFTVNQWVAVEPYRHGCGMKVTRWDITRVYFNGKMRTVSNVHTKIVLLMTVAFYMVLMAML